MNCPILDDTNLIKLLSVILFFAFVCGCGAVGSPIPPEDVGIEAKVKKQQQGNIQTKETLSENNVISVEEEGVQLPELYPIGTR